MSQTLPVTLPPLPDELLSSWINRHAIYYGVSPRTMLRHCMPSAASFREIDLTLNINQTTALSRMFFTSSKKIQRMSFAASPKVAHRFIARVPAQRCERCRSDLPDLSAVLRSEMQGWRITCPLCGELFRDEDGSNCDAVFEPYLRTALRGEKLLSNHVESGRTTWLPPLEIARLLLMRRLPWPIPQDGDLYRYRILGAVIPDLDAIVAKQESFHCSPKHPIVPLHLRPALLAGVAIIERAGPAMLKMLQTRMIGENKKRFVEATDHLITPAFEWGSTKQMQLI